MFEKSGDGKKKREKPYNLDGLLFDYVGWPRSNASKPIDKRVVFTLQVLTRLLQQDCLKKKRSSLAHLLTLRFL